MDGGGFARLIQKNDVTRMNETRVEFLRSFRGLMEFFNNADPIFLSLAAEE